MRFWTAADLEEKLLEFQRAYDVLGKHSLSEEPRGRIRAYRLRPRVLFELPARSRATRPRCANVRLANQETDKNRRAAQCVKRPRCGAHQRSVIVSSHIEVQTGGASPQSLDLAGSAVSLNAVVTNLADPEMNNRSSVRRRSIGYSEHGAPPPLARSPRWFVLPRPSVTTSANTPQRVPKTKEAT
jgi:hypothetical protein